MKFAIRDDDLNYFFTPDFVTQNLSEIWDICPVSMSAIPFLVGNWKKHVVLLETLGPQGVTKEILDTIQADVKEYKIEDNKELITFIKDMVKRNRIHITMHGLTHRNNDRELPRLKNNFSIGAEFFTEQNLGLQLVEGKRYLERLFEQKISVFTPPQNMLSERGLNAVQEAALNICSDLPNLRNPRKFLKQNPLSTYLKIISHKLFREKGMIYPYSLQMRRTKIIDHCRLQPKSQLKTIKEKLKFVHERNGSFVLSTHSYSFDQKMIDSNQTMKDSVIDLLNYVKAFPDAEFVTIDELFK